MGKKSNTEATSFLQILLGVFAVLALKSLFENDNSKIISKKGSNILMDPKKMREIEDKIKSLEGQNNQNEIII